MSYDLRVWCVHRPEPPSGDVAAAGRGWQVMVDTSACLAEDVPDAVGEQLPGIQHLVEIGLEPIHAPKAGLTAAWKIARAIAASAHGVIEDPQEDALELPSKVKRFAPVRHDAKERVALLELSWWFDHERLFEPGAVERFLDVLQRVLPEAMPRRYGRHEPPAHQLAATGRDHFVELLTAHLDETVVWYAHRPVLGVSKAIAHPPGWITFAGKPTFRCNRIAITVEATALEQPGWQVALQRAWRAISHELRPFFGDVRTLRGHLGGGRYSDGETEDHPIKSWWWHGVPTRLGHAAVIGAPYLAVWPQVAAGAALDDGLAFVSTSDWRSDGDAADLVGGVPPGLAVGFMPYKGTRYGGTTTIHYEDYPTVFPFSRPTS